MRHCYSYAPACQQQPEATTDECQYHALGQKLAYHAGLTGTHCGANGKLPTSRCGTCEQKIGDVYASNKKNECYRCQQDQKNRANSAHHLIVERVHLGSDFLIVRVDGGQIVGHSIHVSSRLFDGDAILKPAYAVKSEPRTTVSEYRIFPLPKRKV